MSDDIDGRGYKTPSDEAGWQSYYQGCQQDAITKMAVEIAALTKERDELRARCDDLERHFEDYEMEAKEHEEGQMQGKVLCLEAEIERNRQQIAEVIARAEAAEQKLEAVETELNTLKTEMGTVEFIAEAEREAFEAGRSSFGDWYEATWEWVDFEEWKASRKEGKA